MNEGDRLKRILVLCLVVLMMAGCAKEEKTVNRAVFAWEGVEEADEQLLENYRIDTIFMDIKAKRETVRLIDFYVVERDKQISPEYFLDGYSFDEEMIMLGTVKSAGKIWDIERFLSPLHPPDSR